MRSYGLSTDNLEVLDFLQSENCKKILTTNKLKIHVETGNIYYDNNDTSKSIFDFFLKQQDPTKGIIEHDFVYGGSYNDYFQWLIDGFDSQEKTKLDVLTSKNAKFFFYRMNEVLQANNLPLKKVKHSVVTEDYIAIEKIQSQNWQYFVESVLEACRRKNSGETVYQHQSKLIKASVENVTIAKKTYKSFYKQITDNLTFMLDNLPDDEFKEIINDLHTENYLPDNFDNFLDCWCEFYFHKGRFSGSQELVMVLQTQIPPFIKAQMPLSPIDLYQNFKATDARALVSIQALAALNIHLRGYKTISKNALSEFLHNLYFKF